MYCTVCVSFQIKTVAIVTGLQNTVLAKVIIQMSYPASDAGIMVVMLTCIDFATLLLMILTYLPHCCLWFCWTKYRWSEFAAILVYYLSIHWAPSL